ncbi:MAG: rhodanese-like domain-containing protein [bacterium]|jgi:rhodanese-related sulfurtransferase
MRISIISLAVILLASGPAHSHTDVTPAWVRAWMDTAGSGVIVDVREESEFCDSTYSPPNHIPGAINMPWNSGYFLAHYTELPADEDIIIVCRSGNRSNQAANFLDGLSYQLVYDMTGGMNAWLWETESCLQAGVPWPEENSRESITLGPAAPNPFTSRAVICFTLPDSEPSGDFSLGIYDARGRLVATLAEASAGSGTNRAVWDGTDDGGRPLASGIYFYRLTLGDRSLTRRIVLIR